MPTLPPKYLLPLCSMLFCAMLGPCVAHATDFFSAEDKKQPLEITAMHLEIDRATKISTFSDNVVVKKSDFTIACDKMEVLLEAQKSAPHAAKTPANTVGAEVDTIYFYGHVTIEKQGKIAKGERGIYQVADSKLFLYDHVTLQEGSNFVQGDQLLYDLKRDLATVQQQPKKHGKQKVRATFLPKKQPESLQKK